MSEHAQSIEHPPLPPRTTFGIGDLGLEQAEIDLAISLMKKRHRGDIDELIRAAAFMGLHQMMAHEVETQQARSKQSAHGAQAAAA
jgi:hypothetical protein